MKTIVFIAAVAMSFTAPAFAQSALDIAIANHNSSADNASERIVLAESGLTMGTAVSGRNGSVLLQAVNNHNRSVDRAGDRINPEFLTTFSGNVPAHAAGIIARLAEASREND